MHDPFQSVVGEIFVERRGGKKKKKMFGILAQKFREEFTILRIYAECSAG